VVREKKDVVEGTYNEDSIQVLEGLEAVRKRPGMYIGSTDGRGLHHLVYEIFDNAVDEALAGHGDTIKVIIENDNSIRVRDYGRGMPTGMHKTGVSTPEVIFTVLHAGGKFGQGGYKTSGGLHGVGSSVVNALSEQVEVTIHRDGYDHFVSFHNGGKVNQKLKKLGKTSEKETGTEVWFKPDKTIFSTLVYNFDTLSERLRETAFLMSGLHVILEDKRKGKEKVEEYKYENGLEAFIDYLNEEKSGLHKVVSFSGATGGIEIDFSFQYTDGYSENILSFVNNVRTRDGGTHETGAKGALTRVLNDYARKLGLLKVKDKNLEGSDVREGISAILSVRIPENLLQFEGQTKSKLGTSDARSAVDNVVAEKFMYFLNETPDVAELLVRKAIKSAKVREESRKARDEARNGKGKKRADNLLSGKLTPAQSKDPRKNELYLVEGDSAGGSAKQGRDRKYQAILPLRGKVINTEKAKLDEIMKNEEIKMMIHAIGCGVGSEFDLADCNYEKVVIMTDADTDGAHIQVLLLTFFYRYMKPLIEAGKVYIALSPLYKVSKGAGSKQVMEYAWTEDDLKAAIKKVGKGYTIQRFKGLGEMNADQLWETTMDPRTRTFIQVTIDDIAKAEKRVSVLMGDKVEPRRDWIEKNVEFGMK
jgi:topoisomerase-4 subunit B